jgi:hypothetical protein
MATETATVFGIVQDGGTVICMGRILNRESSTLAAFTQSDITSITYTVSLIDDSDKDTLTAVTNHTAVSLTVSAVIFNTMQTPSLWTQNVDATGYNFRHTIPISTNPAFTTAGRRYKIVYTCVPVVGQKENWVFEVMCV